MRITVEKARQFFAHPSQHAFGMTEDDLPEDYIYHADGGVCLAFHPVLWPGVYAVHVGAMPEAIGATTAPVRRLLAEFAGDMAPKAIIAAIDEKNRLAIALARRVGGEMAGAISPGLIIMEWRPQCPFSHQ